MCACAIGLRCDLLSLSLIHMGHSSRWLTQRIGIGSLPFASTIIYILACIYLRSQCGEVGGGYVRRSPEGATTPRTHKDYKSIGSIALWMTAVIRLQSFRHELHSPLFQFGTEDPKLNLQTVLVLADRPLKTALLLVTLPSSRDP